MFLESGIYTIVNCGTQGEVYADDSLPMTGMPVKTVSGPANKSSVRVEPVEGDNYKLTMAREEGNLNLGCAEQMGNINVAPVMYLDEPKQWTVEPSQTMGRYRIRNPNSPHYWTIPPNQGGDPVVFLNQFEGTPAQEWQFNRVN